MKILPLDESDREMLEADDLSRSLALTPQYTPNWSHVYVFRIEVFQHFEVWKKFDTHLAGKEYMTLYGPKCGVVYLFVASRPREYVKGYYRGDTTLTQLADEVIELHNFIPDVGKMRYVKCRSEDIKGLSPRQHKGKFFRNFMERTVLR